MKYDDKTHNVKYIIDMLEWIIRSNYRVFFVVTSHRYELQVNETKLIYAKSSNLMFVTCTWKMKVSKCKTKTLFRSFERSEG